MTRFSKPSLARLRQFSAAYSKKRLRNIWISGLIDPNNPTLIQRSTFESERMRNHNRAIGKRMEELSREEEAIYVNLSTFIEHTMRCLEEKRPAINSLAWKDYKVIIIIIIYIPTFTFFINNNNHINFFLAD